MLSLNHAFIKSSSSSIYMLKHICYLLFPYMDNLFFLLYYYFILTALMKLKFQRYTALCVLLPYINSSIKWYTALCVYTSLAYDNFIWSSLIFSSGGRLINVMHCFSVTLMVSRFLLKNVIVIWKSFASKLQWPLPYIFKKPMGKWFLTGTNVIKKMLYTWPH